MPRLSNKSTGGPLQGLTFLNTREAGAAPALTRRLEARGARVLECPTIAFVPPADWTPFDTRLKRISEDDWIVFTSATAVRFALERISALNEHPSRLNRARIAVIGKGTAQALEAHEVRVDLVPPRFQQESLLEVLVNQLSEHNTVWIPRAQEAREALVNGLREAGLRVEVTPVYRTVPPPDGLGAAAEALRSGRVDWVLFTSSSTVLHFMALLDPALREHLTQSPPRIGCLGAITAETAREHGLVVSATPEQQDLDGLVAAVVSAVQAPGAKSVQGADTGNPMGGSPS